MTGIHGGWWPSKECREWGSVILTLHTKPQIHQIMEFDPVGLHQWTALLIECDKNAYPLANWKKKKKEKLIEKLFWTVNNITEIQISNPKFDP